MTCHATPYRTTSCQVHAYTAESMHLVSTDSSVAFGQWEAQNALSALSGHVKAVLVLMQHPNSVFPDRVLLAVLVDNRIK